MQDDAYRAYLLHRLTRESTASYLSNARRVERTLGIDLDHIALTDDGIATVAHRIRELGVSKAKTADCRSALKAYAAFMTVTTASTAPMSPPQDAGPPGRQAANPHEREMADLSVPQLMRLYADVLAELRHRGVTRTDNGPVGDYAEMLFQQAFGWTLATTSAAGHDAVDSTGTRYQIKARRGVGSAGARQLGAIRRLPERTSDARGHFVRCRRKRLSRGRATADTSTVSTG